MQNVIKGTGIVLHTNFGRGPIGKKGLQNVIKKITGYVNLEVDLVTGKRGGRHYHLSEMFAVINNTAGGIIVFKKAKANID